MGKMTLTHNKPFWSIFAVQFLGAFNDNFFRSAFITLLTYHFVDIPETSKAMFVSAAFGLFMTPFFLFSPLAGQLATCFDKARIVRWVKAAEVMVVFISCYGFMTQNPYVLLVALFCMGTHSTVFGPAKYALLPELLPESALLKANGYIEAGGFFAIMGGTLTGAFMVHLNLPAWALCTQLLGISCLGFLISLGLKPKDNPPGTLHFSWFKEVGQLYRVTRKYPDLLIVACGLAWFWFVGSLLIAQLPPFTKQILQADEGVFIFFLFLFTCGTGIGSTLCHWVFRGEITLRYLPLLAALMIPPLWDLSTFAGPLQGFDLLRLSADIVFVSLVGGLFVVPLYAYQQARAAKADVPQIVAFGNILMAGAMVLVSFGSFVLLSLGASIPDLIRVTAIGQIIATALLFLYHRKQVRTLAL